ncbi:hypothetical protein BS78_10G154800 [Paspalum vaginatum]|nr:hypothetical protein BS78_10G154800 [Paspalum vaginatum]
MLTLHPRMVSSSGAKEDHDEGCVCYFIVAACVSVLLFVVLAAAVTVARACLITGAVVLLLALGSWLAPPAGNDTGTPPAAPRLAAHQQHHRCACGGVAGDAALAGLPTFAYEPPAAPLPKDDDGKPRASSVLCAVCLDDVQAGEMVRQLPVCRHLFHVDCVDAWLRAHRSCPLCRCDLFPPNATAKADALPPV